MKKSEFVAMRREHWTRKKSGQCGYEGEARVLVERDVDAAEAAGVTWDNVEASVPARLQYDATRAVVEDAADGQIVVDLSLDRNDAPGEFARRYEPVLCAMVDAYNAWGPRGTARAQLAEILDGDDRSAAPLPRDVSNALRRVFGS